MQYVVGQIVIQLLYSLNYNKSQCNAQGAIILLYNLNKELNKKLGELPTGKSGKYFLWLPFFRFLHFWQFISILGFRKLLLFDWLKSYNITNICFFFRKHHPLSFVIPRYFCNLQTIIRGITNLTLRCSKSSSASKTMLCKDLTLDFEKLGKK